MDANDWKRYICAEFDGVRLLEGFGDLFFLYDPAGDLPPERQHPFATIVTGDHYEKVADLDRPDAYRINIGLTRATYASLLGAPPTERDADGVLRAGVDYAAVDTVLPHPVYATQHWVGVVEPGAGTGDTVRALLAEAYAFAVRKYDNHRARHDRIR